jgi:hypothetical protein
MTYDANALTTLNNKHALIRDRIRAVSSGQFNGLYLFGRPGTSKTFLVRTLLKQLNQRYAYSNGHLTPVGLFDLIGENPQSVIVLDDVTTIFEKPLALQIFLAALGNSHDGSRVRTVRYKTANGDQVIHFTGSVIAISNLPLNGHSNNVMQALQDRIHVVGYEPTDEEIEAQIYSIAGTGPRNVNALEAIGVADYLLEKCREFGVRPSLRLFLDKAIPDYSLWYGQNSELHWHDLVQSGIRQLAIEPGHQLRDMTRQDQVTAERKLVAYLCDVYCSPEVRLEEWTRRTGKSKSAFYRRKKEVEATLAPELELV